MGQTQRVIRKSASVQCLAHGCDTVTIPGFISCKAHWGVLSPGLKFQLEKERRRGRMRDRRLAPVQEAMRVWANG